MPDNQEDELQPVMQSALRLLGASPKSHKELKERLLGKAYDPVHVDTVLNKLERNGLLDDRAFAAQLIERFTRGKPSGNQRIGFELRRRGVPSRICEELTAGFAQDEERERAAELAGVRWERLEHLNPEKRIKRVFDFLLRRGFSYDSASAAIQEIRRRNSENE